MEGAETMLLIEEKQVREILTPEKCVAAMRQAFMDLENGKCDMPQRLICKLPNTAAFIFRILLQSRIEVFCNCL